MKNIFKILVLPVAIIATFFGVAPVALAVTATTPLDVLFVPNPLFNNPDFLPEDVTTGKVTVTNNSGKTQAVQTEAINILDDDSFGSLLHLKIVSAGVTLYDNSLHEFFVHGGEVPLGTLASGSSAVYDYTISFLNSNDNSYQGKTLGFDICVGYQGGDSHCGVTVVGPEVCVGSGCNPPPVCTSNCTPPPAPCRDNCGPYYPPVSNSLIIFNERSLDLIASQSNLYDTTITWDTNMLSSSQVVYGLASGAPYTLVMTPPNFGYPFATVDDLTKVIHHSMPITGLIPGQTYVYRVISHASPPTVSAEHSFTVPLKEVPPVVPHVEPEFDPVDPFAPVLRVGQPTPATTTATTTPENNNLAAIIGAGFDFSSPCFLISILFLVLMYIVWRMWLRKRFEKEKLDEEIILNRANIYFGSLSVLVIVIALIVGRTCPLWVYVIVFILSVATYYVRKYANRNKNK